MALENQRIPVPLIFQEFGNVHEPDIIKRIFFYLDYNSFKKCQRVCRSWRSLLTSEAYISMGKTVFLEKLVDIERELYDKASEGELDEVMRLISCPMVDVNCERLCGELPTSPLCSAIREGHMGVIQALLDRGADPNKSTYHHGIKDHRYNHGMSPLRIAIFNGFEEIVRVLLDYGANPNETSYGTCMTALHMAAIKSRERIIRLLIHAGADPSPANNKGHTPLHLVRSHMGVITELINGGAAVDKPDNSGCTPLYHAASMRRNKFLVLALIQHGANPDGADHNGGTALHRAALFGCTPVVEVLLERGADPNKRNNLGQTPLHIAVIKFQKNVAQTLVKSLARTDVADNDGRTPLTLATGDKEMIDILNGTVPGLVEKTVKDSDSDE